MIITILSTVFVLGILVFVHEVGHFWAAKRLGMKVLRFSLGFGPKLFTVKREETEYCISALPLGGYVKLAGEDAFDDGYVPQPGDYLWAPWWSRSLMALAGPMANLATAVLLFIAIGLIGIKVPDFPATVGKVHPSTAAQKAGFLPGDEILSLDGTPVTSWHDLSLKLDAAAKAAKADSRTLAVRREKGAIDIRIVSRTSGDFLGGLEPSIPAKLGEISVGLPAYQAGLSKGDQVLTVNGQPVMTFDDMRAIIYRNADKEVQMTVLRGRDTLRLALKPLEQEVPGQGKVGVIGVTAPEFGSYLVRLGPAQALLNGLANTGGWIARTYDLLFKIVVKPSNAKQIGGVVMVGQMAGTMARRGFSDLLFLMAVLSVSLLVINLLPLPVMDGGVIFFALVEGFRKRPLSNKIQLVIQQVGFGFIVFLFLFTIYNDGSRIWNRRSALKSNQQQLQGRDTVK